MALILGNTIHCKAFENGVSFCPFDGLYVFDILTKTNQQLLKLDKLICWALKGPLLVHWARTHFKGSKSFICTLLGPGGYPGALGVRRIKKATLNKKLQTAPKNKIPLPTFFASFSHFQKGLSRVFYM